MGFSNGPGETRRPAAPAPLAVRPAAAADVAAIMGVERTPGFESVVGRSEEAEHRAMLAAQNFAYRIGLSEGGEPLAFAILSVLDEAFEALGAWRFHLDCFADNFRAQRAYAKLGFSRGGLLRQAYRRPDGTRTDLVLMALLKPEWRVRKAGTAARGAF
jgi:RimJ/RimL family protein N-acetyltransferase